MSREISLQRVAEQTALETLLNSLPPSKDELQALVKRVHEEHKGKDPRPSLSPHHTLAIILGNIAKAKIREGTVWVYSRRGKPISATKIKDEDLNVYKSAIGFSTGMRAIEAFYAEETIDSSTLWKWFDENAEKTVLQRIVSRDNTPVLIEPPKLTTMIRIDGKDPTHGIYFTSAYDLLPERLRFFLNDETASIRLLRSQVLPLFSVVAQNLRS